MLTVGSLFSGVGGIELGFKREGFETKWFIENNEYCKAVLRKHWPDVPIYGDISTVDFTRLESVDILTGGFPCQDISCANPKGEGIVGSRSGLWVYYKEAIRILRPRYAVIENVPNLINKGLNVVLGDLAEIGYDAEWNIVSARSVGARHLRRRLFIVAYPKFEGLERREERLQEGSWNRFERCGTDVADSNQLNGNDGGRRAGAIRMEQSEATKLRGSEEDVANITIQRLPQPETSEQPLAIFDAERGSLQLRELREQNMQGIWRRDPADIPDTDDTKTTRQREHRREISSISEPEGFNNNSKGGWSTESRVGRVADGIPKRVDRLKFLGNAVVPQVAQFIAQRIKETEK